MNQRCPKTQYHFISVLNDCCYSLSREESEEIHVEKEEEEEKDEIGGIESNQLLDFLYI